MKILFAAPFKDFEARDGGYGISSDGLLSVLRKMQKEESIDYIEKIDTINTLNLSQINIPKEKYDVLLMVSSPFSFINPSISIVLKKLLEIADRRYLSLVWETQPLPESWNFLWKSDLFTGFITPSFFVGEQIIKNTDKPVFYVPHYIDINSIEKIDIEKKLKEDKFTVLFMGQNTERKSIKEALTAFIRAMHVNKDSRMILKYHLMTDKELPIEPTVKSYTILNCTKWLSSIYSLTEELKREDVIKLYNNSSVLLFPSKGEGFGLPVAEAMSVGLPVIYTNWSSLPEVADATGNIPINYYLDETVHMSMYGYEYGSHYAYPLLSELTDAIREKYNLWKKDKKAYYEEISNNRLLIDYKFGYKKIKECLNNVFINNLDNIIK